MEYLKTRKLLSLTFSLVMTTAVFSAEAHQALAAGGDLDVTFSGNGKLTTNFDLRGDLARCIAIQADGKIVVAGAGSGMIKIARYNTNGSLDTTFSGDGRVTLSLESGHVDSVASVAIQVAGKILVAGGSSNSSNDPHGLLARFTSIGIHDPTFDGDGIVITSSMSEISDIAIQSNGKIVGVCNDYSPGLNFMKIVRYNTSGSLDTTFGTTGIVGISFGPSQNAEVSALAILPSGKIIAAGHASPGVFSEFALTQYNSNGTLDTTFGGNGIVLTDFTGSTDAANDVKVQPDGKIVAAGYATTSGTQNFALARYNADGTLDTTFSGDGKVETNMRLLGDDSVNALAIQSNGRIVAVGDIGNIDFALARYNPDGGMDQNFGQSGRVFTDVVSGSSDESRAIAIQTDGKIVVAGTSQTSGGTINFAVVRYLPGSGGTAFDYDGDGKTDISVFRSSGGSWYLLRSMAGFFGTQFGAPGDRIVPADYDGDGKTDIAVYRPSTGFWYVTNSSNNTLSYYAFGIAEDLPTPADYDGDGKADISVFRPSSGTWYRTNSSDSSFVAVQFGASGDRPTIGDFDGDGKADVAVFRPSNGTWYQLHSSNGSFFAEQFGIATDRIVPADYDGDGKTDLAIYRPSDGLWYLKNSSTSTYTPFVFGLASDIPAPGDYDGDGRTDIAVFRPSNGTWYLQQSTAGFAAVQFGAAGDVPTPAAFVP